MQVHRTPVLINGDSETMTVTVGAGGPGVYYGPNNVNLESQSTAAPGSTFTVTSPTYVKTQGGRDESSDISVSTSGAPSPASGIEAVNAVATAGAAQTISDPAAGAATVNVLTLTAANCVLTLPPDPPAGRATSLTLVLVQDATGGRTVSWPAGTKWPNKAGAPTLSVAAGAVDYFTLINRGAGWVAASMLNVG